MFLVYNSDLLDESRFSLSANDRAFRYGDGLFETIRYENGHVWFWSDHVERLTAGLTALQLITDVSANLLHGAILDLLTANQLIDQCARVKIQVWRQPGGLYTPLTNQANCLITAQPGQPFSMTGKTKIGIYEHVPLAHSPVSAYKTLNSLPYVLAGLYKQQHGYDDVILLNADPARYLAECSASNLFWFDDGVLYTPALETGCVSGILRRRLLRTAIRSGIPVNDGFHPQQSLAHAEAVFCANVSGIQWFRHIDGIGGFPDAHPLAERLFRDVLASTHRP